MLADVDTTFLRFRRMYQAKNFAPEKLKKKKNFKRFVNNNHHFRYRKQTSYSRDDYKILFPFVFIPKTLFIVKCRKNEMEFCRYNIIINMLAHCFRVSLSNDRALLSLSNTQKSNETL